MGLWRRFSRWRHGRGFGIHSPLAYDLVMSTLRCRYAYYGDAVVDGLFDNGRDRRRGRALLRVAARFNPLRVAFQPTLDSRWAIAVRQGAAHLRNVAMETQADLYVTSDMTFEPPAGHPCVTVYLGHHRGAYRHDDKDEDVGRRMGPIVIDNARDMAVAVRRAGLTAKTVIAKF